MYRLTEKQYQELSLLLGEMNCEKCKNHLKIGKSVVPRATLNVRQEDGHIFNGGEFAIVPQICEKCGMKDITMVKLTKKIRRILS